MVISFDFWGTIAKSNPKFKHEQALLIGMDPVEYKSKTDQLKAIANEAALDSEYPTLPHIDHFYPVDKSIRENFIEDSKELFLKIPPIVLKNTVKVLRDLLELKKSSPHLKLRVGIVSNTLSMPGSIIRTFLFEQLGLRLDFFNFSDELEVCKPNSLMFDTRFGKVNLHVGDNPAFDNVDGIKFLNVKNLSMETILPIIHKESSSNSTKKGSNTIVTNIEGTVFTEYDFSFKKFNSREDISFSPTDYGKLKYGSKLVAETFGKLLSKSLVRSKVFSKFLEDSKGKRILISGSPYKYLPAAATALKNSVLSNLALEPSITNEIVDFKVFRKHSYTVDYGAMNKEDRSGMLKTDGFYLDKEFIKDTSIIFMDDIKITGSHEEFMRDLLVKAGFTGNVLYLYFGEFTGDGNPNIENYLNNHYVGELGLKSINYLIQTEGFILNTRVCKYILRSNNEEFKEFINLQTKDLQKEIFVGAVHNSYTDIPEFQENLKYLKQLINYKN